MVSFHWHAPSNRGNKLGSYPTKNLEYIILFLSSIIFISSILHLSFIKWSHLKTIHFILLIIIIVLSALISICEIFIIVFRYKGEINNNKNSLSLFLTLASLLTCLSIFIINLAAEIFIQRTFKDINFPCKDLPNFGNISFDFNRSKYNLSDRFNFSYNDYFDRFNFSFDDHFGKLNFSFDDPFSKLNFSFDNPFNKLNFSLDNYFNRFNFSYNNYSNGYNFSYDNYFNRYNTSHYTGLRLLSLEALSYEQKEEFCRDKNIDYNTKQCSNLEKSISLANSVVILAISLILDALFYSDFKRILHKHDGGLENTNIKSKNENYCKEGDRQKDLIDINLNRNNSVQSKVFTVKKRKTKIKRNKTQRKLNSIIINSTNNFIINKRREKQKVIGNDNIENVKDDKANKNPKNKKNENKNKSRKKNNEIQTISIYNSKEDNSNKIIFK